MEAGDVTSLLEQFEASEVTSDVLKEEKAQKHVPKQVQVQEERQTIQQEDTKPPPTKIRKTSKKSTQTKQSLLKKSLKTEESKLHQDIKNSLPKEVIDRIKVIVAIYPNFNCMFQ